MNIQVERTSNNKFLVRDIAFGHFFAFDTLKETLEYIEQLNQSGTFTITNEV